MRALVAVPALLALAGCQTIQSRADEQCRAVGWESAQCEYIQRAAQADKRSRAALGAALIMRPRPQVYQPALRSPTMTTCSRFGNQLSCNHF